MMTKKCNIILDLLPNYIEGLTSKETNDFINEHLAECHECNKKYKNMRENFEISTYKGDNRQILGLKKIHKKLNILKITLILTLTISLSIMTYYYFYMRNAYSGVIKDMVEMVDTMNKNGITFDYDENRHIKGIIPIDNEE